MNALDINKYSLVIGASPVPLSASPASSVSVMFPCSIVRGSVLSQSRLEFKGLWLLLGRLLGMSGWFA